MSLLDDLKERRAEVVAELETQEAFVVAHQICVEDKRAEIADLDRAIAALLSPHVEDPGLREVQAYTSGRLDGYTQAIQSLEAEKETAREQLEREPEIPEGFTKWEGGECPVDPSTYISVMFLDGEISHDGVIAGHMNWAHDVSCAARIYAYRVTEQASVQDETLDQGASEPVVRASPGEVEESRDQSTDEQDDASEFAEIEGDGLGSSLIAMGYGDDDIPSEFTEPVEEAMQDEREEPVELSQPEWNEPQPTEGYAPVTNPEAHIQAVEAERYAQPTNPDADAIARAHDWYDPKAVADRERNAGLARLFAYNPFYKPKVDA